MTSISEHSAHRPPVRRRRAAAAGHRCVCGRVFPGWGADLDPADRPSVPKAPARAYRCSLGLPRAPAGEVASGTLDRARLRHAGLRHRVPTQGPLRRDPRSPTPLQRSPCRALAAPDRGRPRRRGRVHLRSFVSGRPDNLVAESGIRARVHPRRVPGTCGQDPSGQFPPLDGSDPRRHAVAHGSRCGTRRRDTDGVEAGGLEGIRPPALTHCERAAPAGG